MNDNQKETITIQVVHDDDEKIIKLTVGRYEKIKQNLCKYFSLIEKEQVVKINEKICDSSESFDDYFQDDKPLKVQTFNINQLIEDQKELQSLRNSQTINGSSILTKTSSVVCQTIQECNQLNTINTNKVVEKVNDHNEVFSSMISIYDQNQFSSQIIEQIVVCIYCQQNIKKNILQTPCQHFFHSECLDIYIYNTLQLSSTTLSCLCNCKLPLKFLNMLDEDKCRKYKELLSENQLFYFQKSYSERIGRCIDNQNCKFWFFIQNNTNTNTNTNSQIHKKITCFQCSNQKNIEQTISSSPEKNIEQIISSSPEEQIPIILEQGNLVQLDTQSNHTEDKKQDQQLQQQDIEKVKQQDIIDDIRTQKLEDSNVFSNKHIDQEQTNKIQSNTNEMHDNLFLQKQTEQEIKDQEEKNSEQGI